MHLGKYAGQHCGFKLDCRRYAKCVHKQCRFAQIPFDWIVVAVVAIAAICHGFMHLVPLHPYAPKE